MILKEVMPIAIQLHWKMFYSICPCGVNVIKLFQCNLATQAIFIYDFEGGYADSNVIALKNVL
jgi:hypothetical protein